MTSFAEDILDHLEELSKTSRVKSRGRYTTAHATFDVENFDKVLEKIDNSIEPILKNGEKIENNIRDGEIVDCGLKQFKILKGKFFEVYDYGSTTAIFIRLYHVKGDTEWLALYIDENPDTPWWGDE